MMQFQRLAALLLALGILSSGASAQSQKTLPYLDPSLPTEQRVDDLVSRMTLEEKVPQLINTAPAIPRLNVPAYDYWSEDVATLEYKGQRVLPDFDRFRKDLTILAGHYHPVVNLKGEVRIEADSLKWASMDEATFGKLYDQTIAVLLRRVFNGAVCPRWTEQQLRDVAAQILEFAA